MGNDSHPAGPGPRRSVLVTGCSSGIGACVAAGLRARGYEVVASARREGDLTRLRAEGHVAVQLDLANPASVERGFEQAMEHTEGRLYGLFNNGAYGQPGAVEDLSREALREQFETNLFGTHDLTVRALRVMRAAGEGRVVHNSSVLGLVAMPYRGAYNASKFALEGLTDTLRLELAGSNVFVCLIEPGPITSRFRDNAERAFRRHVEPARSAHREAYEALAARLRQPGPVAPFTLPPEAVLARVLQALEAERPRPRYYVTVPTHLFGALRRLLPSAALDAVLRRVGDSGRR